MTELERQQFRELTQFIAELIQNRPSTEDGWYLATLRKHKFGSPQVDVVSAKYIRDWGVVAWRELEPAPELEVNDER